LKKERFETIKELKQDFPEVKIIAISGVKWIEPEDYLKLAKRLWANRTLAKLFDRRKMLEATEELPAQESKE